MGKNEHKTVLNCSLYIYVHKFQVDPLLHLAALHHLPPEVTILYLHFYFWPPAPMRRCPTHLIPTLHVSLQKQKHSEQTASCSAADLHSCLFLYSPSLFPFSALCANCIKPGSSSPSFSEASPVSAIALTPFKVWLMLDFLSASHHPFFIPLVWSPWFSWYASYTSSSFPRQHLCIAAASVWKPSPLCLASPVHSHFRSHVVSSENLSWTTLPAIAVPLCCHCVLPCFTFLYRTYHYLTSCYKFLFVHCLARV